jgi:hypothetical protein
MENEIQLTKELVKKHKKQLQVQSVLTGVFILVFFYPFTKANSLGSSIVFIIGMIIIAYTNMQRDRQKLGSSTYMPYNVAPFFREKSKQNLVLVIGYVLFAISIIIANASKSFSILYFIVDLIGFYLLSGILLPLVFEHLDYINSGKRFLKRK